MNQLSIIKQMRDALDAIGVVPMPLRLCKLRLEALAAVSASFPGMSAEEYPREVDVIKAALAVQASAALVDEQSAFEKIAAAKGFDIERAVGDLAKEHSYASLATECGWTFWKAKGAAVAPAAPVPVDATQEETKTWKERMPAPRSAFACDMNCSGVGLGAIREKGCGDCMRVTIHGDPIAARDAEIADLRAALDKAQGVAPAHDATERSHITNRLRAVVDKLGLATAVPESDETLYGCMFSVLGMVLRRVEQLTGTTSVATGDLHAAILGSMPLVEPVYICKALCAGRKAKVVLNDGTGPKAAVHLVNIGLTGWVHTKETAEVFAKGYNMGLEHLRSSLMEIVVADLKAINSTTALARPVAVNVQEKEPT